MKSNLKRVSAGMLAEAEPASAPELEQETKIDTGEREISVLEAIVVTKLTLGPKAQ